MSAIKKAVGLLGGYESTGRACDVSGKAVSKWVKKGRLPRTEWTGETDYASLILAALGECGHSDKLTMRDLRPSLISGRSAA